MPEPAGIGVGGNAFEHDRGGTVQQGAIDDVGVARDPADVGSAPEYVAHMVVEDVLVGGGCVDHVACGGVDDALGLARGSGGVEDEEGVLGIHLCGRALVRGTLHLVVPPDIAFLLHGYLVAGPLNHEDLLDAGGLGKCLVGVGLHGDGVLGTSECGVLGDEDLTG